PPADPANACGDAAGAARRAHYDGRAGGASRCVRSGALPPFREQGADVRRIDRVHRDHAVQSHQQDCERDLRRSGAGAANGCRAAGLRREESGHDARADRRCAGERGRAPAGAHEPVLRPGRSRAAAVAAHSPGGGTLAGRAGGRSQRAHGVRGRALAAVRQDRLQAASPGRLGPAAPVPFQLKGAPRGIMRRAQRMAHETACAAVEAFMTAPTARRWLHRASRFACGALLSIAIGSAHAAVLAEQSAAELDEATRTRLLQFETDLDAALVSASDAASLWLRGLFTRTDDEARAHDLATAHRLAPREILYLASLASECQVDRVPRPAGCAE